MTDFDIAVIGGGTVGAAIAYGLARAGVRTALVDEGDVAHRAARGNFGLVWLQGKGRGAPHYAAWTRRSIEAWPEFAAALADETGIDVAYERPGGVRLCLSAAELEAHAADVCRWRDESGCAVELLEHDALARMLPGLGRSVAGGSYCALDGHADPLRLLRALHAGFLRHGGHYLPGAPVAAVAADGDGFRIDRGVAAIAAGRVVIAAGLGARELAPALGLAAPVAPVRGQIMVSEKLDRFLGVPTATLRQTADGACLFGDSREDAGFDEGTTAAAMGDIARRAVAAFPFLERVRIVRAWGALRVTTADGLPVYEQSTAHPGAFVAVGHSGVTLAAAHATALAGWIADGRLGDEAAPYAAARLAGGGA